MKLERKRVKKEKTKELEEEEEVQWLCSHVYPEVVIWSTDVSQMAASISFSEFELDDYGKPNPFYIAPTCQPLQISEKEHQESIDLARKIFSSCSSGSMILFHFLFYERF